MEKKLIALVFVALMVGLGGGYGMGHVIYQPQLAWLKAEIEDKSWHFVRDFTLKSPLEHPNTSNFSISSDYWRIKWYFKGEGISVWIDRWHGFKVLETGTKNILSSFELYGGTYQGILYIHQGRGTYYIEVSGIEGSFTLKFTIESYH